MVRAVTSSPLLLIVKICPQVTNNDAATRQALMRSMPRDGRESANFALAQGAKKYYYQGQTPPIGLLNPLAWADFISAWKRGDFKNK